MWIYQQSTGILQHDGVEMSTGYSGHGEGCNSPAHEGTPNVGPLPAGLYSIGAMFSHPKKGPVCMRLNPVGHDAHGRSGFMIHGDNSRCDRSASEGCIILDRNTRLKITQSNDKSLMVIA